MRVTRPHLPPTAPQGTERFRLAALLALALMAIGALVAHSLSYRIIEPAAAERAELLQGSGHSYLAAAPTFAALCLAVTILLFGRAISGARAGGASSRPAWLLALLPVAGFAIQEHLERLFHNGAFPLLTALEPTFIVGLLLQVPFALAALALARLLLRAAQAIGGSLRGERPRRLRGTPAIRLAAQCAGPRIPVLAFGQAERGPPPGLSG